MVLGVPPRLEHCFSSSLIALNLRNVSWCPLAFSPPSFQTRIQAGLWQMALHLLELMFRCGPRPSAITTSSALKGVESWSVALATTQGLRNHGFYGKVLESTCMSDLENFDVTCDLTIHGRSLKFHSTSGVIGSQWLQSLALWRFGRCQGLRLDGISWLSVTRAMAQRWDMSLHLAWTSAKSEVMVSVPLETQWEWTMQLLKDRDLSEVGLCWWTFGLLQLDQETWRVGWERTKIARCQTRRIRPSNADGVGALLCTPENESSVSTTGKYACRLCRFAKWIWARSNKVCDDTFIWAKIGQSHWSRALSIRVLHIALDHVTKILLATSGKHKIWIFTGQSQD